MKHDIIKKLYALGIVVLLFEAATLTFVRAPDYGIAAGNTIYVDDDNTGPIWDGTLAYPFQFIQDGIDNATDGDTVHVKPGTYNENLLINKGIALMGENKPLINAGSGNAINVTSGGITINNFNITNAERGIALNIRDFSSLYNVTIEGGGITITNNIIDATHTGIWFEIDSIFCDMYGNTSVTLGDVRIKYNTITSDYYGIYIDVAYFGSHLYGTSSFTMGNVDFCDNVIDSGDDGIHIYEMYEIGSDLNDDSQFKMGHIRFNNNTITAVNVGIYTDYLEYFGEYMYDDSQFKMGNIEFNNNTINSVYKGMLFWYVDYFGTDMYGNSSFTMGNFQVNSNHITSTDNDGISLSGDMKHFGYYMQDTSTFMMGNIEISRNQVNSGDDALVLYDIEDFGSYMYNESSVTIGNFHVHDNILTSNTVSEGIYQYILDFQTHDYMLDNATLTMGTVEFYNNHISGSETGMYFTDLRNVTIKQNTIQNCNTGIRLLYSENNRIYHNNFNNTINALINGNATWDNGYNGGNWWSNYTGSDLLSGPGQNQPDSDGIGDLFHIINGTNIDHYPLMAPFHTFNAGTWNNVTYYVDIVTFSTITNFGFDPFASPNPTLSYDVEGETATSGLCRVTIPLDMMWCDAIGEWTVKVDATIWLRNVIEDGNYTYIYFTYTHSAHPVEIQSIHAVPEFASYLNISLLALLAFLIAIMYRKKLVHTSITQK